MAVITWHKGFKGEAWPETDFRNTPVNLHSPAGATRSVTGQLAHKRMKLKHGPEVRQIRRLLDNGRQVPLVTTDFHTPMAQIASALFSRYLGQENFFKTMREKFNLPWALAAHGLGAQDPEALVVNPRWRMLDRSIQRLRRRLGTLRNRIADLSRGTPSCKGAEATWRRLQARSDTLDAERETLERQRAETPRHITVAELPSDQALDALPEGEKLLLYVIRLIANRAETRMMPAVAQAQGKRHRPRRHLRALFQAEADILPYPERGIRRIRIPGTGSDAGDSTIAGLPRELSQTRTIFPDANLRMVYELPGQAAEKANAGSTT